MPVAVGDVDEVGQGPAGGWVDPAAVVAGAADVLAGLDVAGVVDVTGFAAAVNQLRAVVDGLWVRAAGELDGRQAYAADKAASACAWLRGHLNASQGSASAAVTTSRRMGAVPLMAAAFTAGEISYEHLRAVTGLLVNEERLAAVGEHDATFLELARRVEPRQLRAMVAYWAVAADPEGAGESQEKAYQARRLSISDSWEGRFYLDGQLDAEGGETVRTAIMAALGAPSVGDGRSAAQRRADALVDIARFFLDAKDLGEVGGERPHVTLTCDLEILLNHRHPDAGAGTGRGRGGQAGSGSAGNGGTKNSGTGPASMSSAEGTHGAGGEKTGGDATTAAGAGTTGGAAATSAGATSAGAGTSGAGTSGAGTSGAGTSGAGPAGCDAPDPRDPGGAASTADAGTAGGGTAGSAGQAADPDAAGAAAGQAADPDAAGAAAGRAAQAGRRIGHTIGPAGLPWLASFPAMFGVGASFARSGPTTLATAERYLCDCAITRVVLAGRSEILDVGRERRLFTKAQRKALAIRDQGCVYPYCDKPPALTDAHHLLPWEAGGPTDLANAALLCRFHHRCVHEGGETLTRDHEGRIHVADGTPRRPRYRRRT